MQDKELQLKKMLETNKVQKDFYEFDPKEKEEFEYDGNFIGRTWAKFRSNYGTVVNTLGEFEMWRDLHYAWMGDLSDKKVLDLGCHAGNQLSLELASKAKEYHGIDLSESATALLQEKIDAQGSTNAKAYAVDLLSDAFKERDFDVVYAQSVFHHFKYMDPFLERIDEILADGGQVITSDPLATYLPMKIFRSLYRPFQRDSAWEFPFTQKTFDSFQNYFDIENVQGMMGNTKWVLVLYPLNKSYAEKKWKQWLKDDQDNANKVGPYLWKCMRVTMNLRKKKK